ncbi:MAG TPA: cytochrome c peroxidase [Vicinamibacterales bacterium]|nr:cytochrome c peroxidase [Vicinamibacterales bacterium]
MSGLFWSSRWTLRLLVTFLVAAPIAAACGRASDEPAAPAPFPALARYDAMTIPADNPMTWEKVELGKQLYYDTRLSGDGQRSCYSCHVEERGLTDGQPVAIGAFDRPLTRSSPTMWNIGYHSAWYWDGRANTLEGQARAAWSGGNMGASGNDGAPSMDQVCQTLDGLEGYRTQFQAVFGAGCTPDNVTKALAAFMRTIVSTDSPWVRFREGDTSALSEAARRGWEVFDQKAMCSRCHAGILLTDQQYHNVGIGMDAADPDLGRYRVTQNATDRGAFKTPTLLDISKSAPYFHNGSVATLEEAVDLMLRGGLDNPNLDRANLQAATLTAEERADLLQFLRELTATYTIVAPTLPN